MKTTTEIKNMLAMRTEEVASLLLPNGKRQGSEWCSGSTQGDAGQSLKVRLDGAKAGVWSDFSSNEKGDLLDLWKAVRGVDFVEALRQAKDWLGIKDERTEAAFRPASTAKRYVRPILDQHEPLTTGGPVFDYLVKERKLEPHILHAYRVQQMTHSKFGASCVFPVFDHRGLAVDLVKYLAVVRSNDGKKSIWATSDSRPHLFGWQAISKDARNVVITEGEIDAMTVAGWGHPALSVPSGVKNLDWIEHDFDALARFDRIYIATDADEPGHACAEAIAQRLGRERCYRVVLLDYKDANEAECSGMFCGADFDDVLNRSKTLDPVELRSAADYSEELWAELNPSQDEVGSETPWRIDWRVRPGEVTIWTGWSGHGKSLLLNHVVLHDFAKTAQRVLIASFEMPVRQSIAQLARMTLGSEPRSRQEADQAIAWLGGGFWFYDVVGVKSWREFLPTFAYAVRRYGIRRIVIDSLLRVGIAEDDYDGQRAFVSALVAFAAEHQVHIHLVAHSRKKDDESRPPGKLDIRGAAAITDLVHNGWSVWRNKERDVKIEEARAKSANGTVPPELYFAPSAQIACWKNRKTGAEPFRSLWLHAPSMQFSDTRSAMARGYMP